LEKYTVLEDLAGIETIEYNPPPLFLIILIVRVYSDMLEILSEAFSFEYEHSNSVAFSLALALTVNIARAM
jgi:hypothetical protein